MQILDGKAVAAKVLADVKAGVAAFTQDTGVTPTLAVILVGDYAPSQIYVRSKKRAADEAGIGARDFLRRPTVHGLAGLVDEQHLVGSTR